MKNSLIGFMQGRLCDIVDGKIQAFPWLDWEREFPIASAMNFRIMEWTLDQVELYKNPLMTKHGQSKIIALCEQYQIRIPSLTGDCFMQAPFWKANGTQKINLQDDFLAICRACSDIGIKLIVIPLVDSGRLENLSQEAELIDFLTDQSDFLSKLNLQVLFESDFKPSQLKNLISKFPKKGFGINYDIGNSAANGYDPIEEFSSYGEWIKNVHIKDRILGGTTVPLKTGNANFELVFRCISKLNYQGNFILQTARAEDGRHAEILVKYRNMVNSWLVNH